MTYKLKAEAQTKKAELSASINKGIKNLKSEGYNLERLNKIMAAEKNYQLHHKKKFPRSEIPVGTRAMVEVCNLLKKEFN